MTEAQRQNEQMPLYDITIRGGSIASEQGVTVADIGIIGDRIAAVEPGLPAGARDIDATGKLVMPGGVDTHCHVEQLSGMGRMSADDWYSASVSAAFGGTTTIVPFAAQHKGQSLKAVADDYAALADAKSVIDYGYHLIVTGTDDATLKEDLPALIRAGISSFKIYMTYEQLKLDDYQILDVFEVAARERALVMVHAENNDVIKWLGQRLISNGHTAPHFHGVSHAHIAEGEATNRAIALARILDVPILIVHVSAPDALEAIAKAQGRGAAIYAETCPHYLTLTGKEMERPDMEGAKYCCSPPLRDEAAQDALWRSLTDGVVQVISSDHAPYSFDAKGKLPHGAETTFKQIANGVPGIELRLPLLFSEGVGKGRLSIAEFIALGITNHARMYGLYPRKGVIAVGSDADIAIWDQDRDITVTYSLLHDRVGYTPYEGMNLRGWPETVVSAGRIIVENETLFAEAGSGRFIPRTPPEPCTMPRKISAEAQTLRQLIGLEIQG